VFATGLGLALAALNVYFRDLSYLWGILVQLWFFATPIVYPPELVKKRISGVVLDLYEANPTAVFADAFRRALYELRFPSLTQFAYLTVVSVASLAFGLWVFNRLSTRFAEEL
jgi:ABC-type polysaccharide/polyol phosphate export permease